MNQTLLRMPYNAVISLLRNVEDTFLRKNLYIHMFFYLHCGRGFNSLHGGRTKICLIICLLCGNPQNNFGPHRVPRHTEHILIWCNVSHPSRNTRDNAAGYYCGQANVYCVVCPVFRCLWKFGLVFQQTWVVVAHTQTVPASLWQGWVENFCVKFSSHRMKIKGCNCWQWPGPKGGKRAFSSTSTYDDWPYSYWPSYLYCQ